MTGSIIVFYIFITSMMICNIARSDIKISSSSSTYHNATFIADSFGRRTEHKTPTVESNTSGAAFRSMCKKEKSPKIIISSRAIKDSERATCKKNNINDIEEILIAKDALIIINSINSKDFNMTKSDIFRAISAREYKDKDVGDNHYKKWSDINPLMPDIDILFYGPQEGSGTHDALNDLVMNPMCHIESNKISGFHKLHKQNDFLQCMKFRNDGGFIFNSSPESLMIYKMLKNPYIISIANASTVYKNKKRIKAQSIDGIMPTMQNIKNNKYPLCRNIYMYVKKHDIQDNTEIADFILHALNIQKKSNGRSNSTIVTMNEKDILDTQKRILDIVHPSNE